MMNGQESIKLLRYIRNRNATHFQNKTTILTTLWYSVFLFTLLI